MSEIDRCFISLKADLASRGIDSKEALEIANRIDGRAKRIAQERNIPLIEAYGEATGTISDEVETAAALASKRKLNNLRKSMERYAYVTEHFPDNPDEGLQAIISGVNRSAQGSRASAFNKQDTLWKDYFGSVSRELEAIDGRPILTNSDNDTELLKALEEIAAAKEPTGRKEIVDVAKIINRASKKAMSDLQDQGILVDMSDPFWLFRQTHRPDLLKRGGVSGNKILSLDTREAFNKWAAFIEDKVDWVRTVPDGENKADWLYNKFKDLKDGVHLKHDGLESGFVGTSDITKRYQDPGLLKWKSHEDFFAYNREYGLGNVRESFFLGLEAAAKNIGIMDKFGTKPEETFNQVRKRLISYASKRDNTKAKAALMSKGMDYRFAEIDGSVNVPASHLGAKISALTRAWNAVTKLGSATLSSFPDAVFYASEARYQGRTLLSGYSELIGGLFKGKGDFERRQLATALGAVSDSMRGQLAYRFSAGDALPGWASDIIRHFFKFNLLEWWTDSLRHSAVIGMSAHLGFNRGLGHGALPEELQRVLGLFNIDAGKWDMLRSVASEQSDGKWHIIPEDTAKVDNAAISAYLGREITADEARIFKRKLENEIRGYYVDRTDYMVLNPQAETHAFMKRGLQPGTVFGELARFVWQFKSFPLQVMKGPIARDIYSGKVNGSPDLLGLTQIMAATTILGYVSLTAKDLAKGATPRDPQDRKTIMDSMVQGGGMGLFGDFMFGGTARYGRGAVEQFLGPTLGQANDLSLIYMRARDGEAWAPGLVRMASQNIPGANLFYAKWAFNHFLAYNIQEQLSPGYIRRLERNMKEQSGNQFFVDPYRFISR